MHKSRQKAYNIVSLYHQRGDAMNQHYNQNYTWEQIDEILAMIHDCIREGRFIISKNENRQENIDFINEYNLNSRRQKEILLKIKTEDFCHSLQNTKVGFEHEVLYVFCPQVTLFNFDGIEELIVSSLVRNFPSRLH